MNEKTKNNKKNIGFYIALCCCVGLISAVGYFSNREEKKVSNVKPSQEPIIMYHNTPEPEIIKETIENTPIPTLSPTVKQKEEKTISVSALEKEAEIEKTDINDENTDVLEKDEPSEFYDGNIVESVSLKSDPTFILPVEGEIKEKFSGENLIYNKTMGDWRTHNGIDILTPEDTEVLVSADGIIDEIYTDYLGNTVVIDHNNGFKTKYSNLGNLEHLTTGTKMMQGDFLAKTGKNSTGENLSEPHLHFEIIKNEKFVNPEDYIN